MSDEHSSEHQAGDAGREPAPSSTSTNGVPETEESSYAGDKPKGNFSQSRGDQKNTMSPFEFGSLLFAGLSFGTLIVVTIVYYCQLREMKKSTEATRIAADAAKSAADIAAEALKASTKAMQIDQRAWVGIDVVKMQDLKAGQPFFTSVRYKNTGKTFALNCRIASAITMSKVTISSADDIKKDNQSYRFAPGKGTLYPGANNFIPFPGGNVVIIDQAIIDKIAAGELIIYIVGEIHYDDIFGDHHVTQFFKRYVPEANAFEEEAGGNDAD